jgi:hypothetical protein
MIKKTIASDLTRLDRMEDADIDYSDIPPLDESFFTAAAAVPRAGKPREPAVDG